MIVFHPTAWDDYQHWAATNRQILKRINSLILECQRHPFQGTGRPELLRQNMKGWWSRRIDRERRLVYRVVGQGDGQTLEIIQCRYHY